MVPAAIRTKNPGAQWPNALSKKFGSTGSIHLNDGNNQGAGNEIAVFPTAVQGAASNMALLEKSYTGLTIAAAELRWSGSHRSSLPGFDGNTKITKGMCSDKKFVIPFMKATADAEAPHGAAVLSDAQWEEAFTLYRQVMHPEDGSAKPMPGPVPAPVPKAKVPISNTNFWTRVGVAVSSIGGLLVADWKVVAVIVVAAGVAFIIWEYNGKPGLK